MGRLCIKFVLSLKGVISWIGYALSFCYLLRVLYHG